MNFDIGRNFFHILYLNSISFDFLKVEESGEVRPLDIEPKSSPTTSDNTKQ